MLFAHISNNRNLCTRNAWPLRVFFISAMLIEMFRYVNRSRKVATISSG